MAVFFYESTLILDLRNVLSQLDLSTIRHSSIFVRGAPWSVAKWLYEQRTGDF